MSTERAKPPESTISSERATHSESTTFDERTLTTTLGLAHEPVTQAAAGPSLPSR